MNFPGTQTAGAGRYAFEVRNGDHVLVSDLPEAQGGGNLGMDPHKLLESALAACTAMTLRMYAERKGWPLEAVDAHIAIAEEKEEETRINRVIELRGPLDDVQRARLLEMANRCPVHRILSGKIVIGTSLARGSV